jgi:hypothetical protein
MSLALVSKKGDVAPALRTSAPSKPAQGSLRIGDPGDSFEREADRIADQVMASGSTRRDWSFSRMGVGAGLQKKCACGKSGGSGGECQDCKEKASLQRKATDGIETTEAPSIVHEVLNTPGQPLDRTTRAFFEQRLGRDFSGVRVHSDSTAAASARAVRALAYTVGNHVVFGNGRYVPGSYDSRKLVAHELVHTVQQSRADNTPRNELSIGEASDTAEREAEGAASSIALEASPGDSGLPGPRPGGMSQPRLQRVLEPITSADDFSQITSRLETIIRSGGPVPAETRVIGSAIVEVPGYKGPTEVRAISSVATDPLGEGADVHHASAPEARTLSATRSISGAGSRREFPFSHVNDAEMKMFEEISHNLPEGAKGRVHFLTLRVRQVNGQTVFEPIPACSGCTRATFEMGSFKGVDMVSHAATHPTGTLDLGGAGGGGTKSAGLEGSGNAGLGETNPLPDVGPSKSLTTALDEAGLKGIGKNATVLAEGEALEAEALAPTMESGSIAELALSEAAGLGFAIVALVATAVWELVVAPKIRLLMAGLEAQRAKELKEEIRKKFELYESQHIQRVIKYCYLDQLRDYEKKGKAAHVNVQLRVAFEDTSGKTQLLGDNPPDSIFDVQVDSVDLMNVSLSDSPAKSSVTPLKRCENCGTFSRGKTFVSNNPLWEQTVSFSFQAPRSERVQKEFEAQVGKQEKPTTGDCITASACFIATVCYGSPLAAEVEMLRRFRNRYLMRTAPGRWFAYLYYRFSPRVAGWLWSRPVARERARRYLVGPIAAMVRSLFFRDLEFASGSQSDSEVKPLSCYCFSQIRIHHVSEVEVRPEAYRDRLRK